MSRNPELTRWDLFDEIDRLTAALAASEAARERLAGASEAVSDILDSSCCDFTGEQWDLVQRLDEILDEQRAALAAQGGGGEERQDT